MKDFLAILGFCTVCFMAGFLVVGIWLGLKEVVIRIRRNYQIKHRFDKPPTAECYCVDCRLHNNESNRCYKFDGWHTAPSWFCWGADPRKSGET